MQHTGYALATTIASEGQLPNSTTLTVQDLWWEFCRLSFVAELSTAEEEKLSKKLTQQIHWPGLVILQIAQPKLQNHTKSLIVWEKAEYS